MKLTSQDMALVSLFAGLTAIGASLSIPLGQVAITMQSLFVILSGLILGGRLGALSQIVYIVLGLMGLPIFAAFTGGPQSIMKPSFGFILGFVFTAYIVGKIAHSGNFLNRKKIWLAALIGSITMYVIGLPYMYYMLNIVMGKGFSFSAIVKIGCLLFLPGDFFKLILACLLRKKILPILNKANLSIFNHTINY